MQRQRRKLTVEDRVAIDLRHKDGWGVRAIARELGRSPSVISTEIVRGRDPDGSYAAGPAQAAATARRDRSGRRAKLAPDGALFAEVTKLLRLQWSPEQIAGRRKRREDGAEMSSGLRVSHEAIYQAIYAVPRGELRRELLACLRQGKPHRGRRPKDGERRGRICDRTNIRERPEEVAGRLVPGHWGDGKEAVTSRNPWSSAASPRPLFGCATALAEVRKVPRPCEGGTSAELDQLPTR